VNEVFPVPRQILRFVSIVIAVLGLTGIARAEVLDAAPHGFTVRYQVAIEADRTTVYNAAVESIGQWWSSDHTVSGDAANLYITATVPGCFCETLGDESGLVHMTISFLNPGVIVRLTGGLGPLGLMGVAGNMTWEFDETDSGTVVTLQYAVGGYMDGGLDTIAAAVDGVLVEAMNRLRSFVETGSPEQG
jgi:hypothetical protein